MHGFPGALRILGFGFLALFLCTVAFPIVVTVLTSLKAPNEVHLSPPTWLPAEPRFENYLLMFEALDLGRALRNSVTVALGSAALVTLAAIPAGYALARYEFRGRRVFLLAILAGLTFSPVVIIVSLYQILNSFDLIDNYVGLILPNAAFALPFSIWLSLAYIRSIPVDLDDAARVDGASMTQILVKVIVPLAAPGIATIFIFSAIQAWNEFLLANTFMVSDSMKPLPVVLYSFVGFRGIEWQFLSAAIVFATVPAVALFLLVQRWLVSGLTGGAVK
ncbi:MAG: carbohydrate ABC transporter permease [Chloroflexota bacterium]